MHLPSHDTTLYDFMLRPLPPSSYDTPWFIDAFTGETFTAGYVKKRTDALATSLQERLDLSVPVHEVSTSARPFSLGPVIAIVSPNDIDFASCVWASHRIGCTVAPCNASSTVDELIHQFNLSRTTAIFAHPSTLDRVLEAAHSLSIPSSKIIVLARGTLKDLGLLDKLPGAPLCTIDDLIGGGNEAMAQGAQIKPPPSNLSGPSVAFLCFSSGTTGSPKAVIIPHSAVIANILQVTALAIPRANSSPGDKALGVIPVSHMFGLLALIHVCPYLGISSVLFGSMPPFDRFLDILGALEVNHLFLVPPLVSAFLKHPAAAGRHFNYFKSCIVAAAPLDADRESAFRKLGGPSFLLSQGFGMTETAGLCTSLLEGDEPCPGSIGRFVAGTDYKVLDANNNPVSAGARGELLIRGPQLCCGYLDNDAANVATFDPDGFLRTGDEVEIHSNGDIFVVDRLKNIIKHKGFQVSPAELEGHLLLHHFVEDVGVVGKPDDRAGETPVAFVVLTQAGKEAIGRDVPSAKEQIMWHVQASKSQYKWLGDVYFVDSIPKLPSGKILTRELKKLLMEPPPSSECALEADITDHRPPSAATLVDERRNSEGILVERDPGSLGSPRSTLSFGSRTLTFNVITDIEKNPNLAGYRFPPEPARIAREKRAEAAPTATRRIREWVSFYRIFFTIVLSLNTLGVGFTLAHRWEGGRQRVTTFALGNILVSLLTRNEIFLRVLYTVLLFLFKLWPPRWFRDAIATFLLHVGGFHSGFAISGTLWLITATIEFFRQGPALVHPVVLAFSVVACVLFFAVCASALPTVRNNHHNVFENVHRLGGWTGLAILWTLVCLANSWSTPEHHFIGSRLTTNPDIYLALGVTICIFLPWTTLRKVPVKAEVLSSSVVLLRFQDGYRSGLFGRVSRHPLKENHAFGIASVSPFSGEHYMCVVGQGDFTRGLIADPPSHLWTRQYKFVGLPYICSFYRSGLYVCTGSAIGVALSIFLQRDPRSRWHLLWVSSNIEKTYATTALKDLRDSYAADDEKGAFERAVTIWDTRKQGRPQLTKLIPQLVERLNVEVVFATSNPQGTAEIVRGCAKQGIPCFGPIWDS